MPETLAWAAMSQQDFSVKPYSGITGKSRSADRASRDALNGNVLLFWIAAFTVLGFFAANILSSPVEMAASFSIDDSFYYYEMAWRTAQHGFVTFDAINSANGVHFLWFSILLAAAYLAPGKIALIYIAYAIGLALIAAAYTAIWHIGSLVQDRRRNLTLVMTLIWTAILIDRQHLMFSGMESPLHMVTLLAALICGLRALSEAGGEERFPMRWYLLFTLALVLVTWTRLDAALFSVSLYLLVMVRLASALGSWQRLPWKILSISIAVAVLGAAMQLAFFYGAGGTLLPISGLVKATGIGPEIVQTGWFRFMSIIFPFATFVDESSPFQMSIAAVAFVALLGYVLKNAARSDGVWRHLWGLTAALGITIPVYAAIVSSQHDPFWRWYLSPVFLFYMLAVAMTAVRVFASLGWRPMHSRVATAVMCTLMPALILLVLASTYRPIPLYQTRAQIGIFLNATLGKDVVLASFNSGQVAFMSERRMINLDGLVNSYDYLKNTFNNPPKLIEFLRENGVRYIVDYDFYWAADEIVANSEVRYAFEIPGDFRDRTIYVRELVKR